MTAKQISELVEASKEIREAVTLDEVLQRDLRERRKQIAKYLTTQDDRFFNSIILGVFEGVPEWYEFKIGSTSRLTLDEDEAAYLKDSVGFLVFNGSERMFAIDGQHRAAGIKIAYEEQIALHKVTDLLGDQFSVIFVAHVDDLPGMKRTRKLFSDININAKPVAPGDRIKIDEQNLNAVVTRRLYANYSYFNPSGTKPTQEGNLISLTENPKLDNDDDTHFTNLLGLYTVCQKLRPLFKKIPRTNEWDEQNVDAFYTLVDTFFNEVINKVDEYKSFFVHSSLTLETARASNKYLLFRPIGLKLLAALYTHFVKRQKEGTFFQHINNISFVFPESQLNKVLWNNGKLEAGAKNQGVAFRLCLHLLGQLDAQETDRLRDNYRELLKNTDSELPAMVIMPLP